MDTGNKYKLSTTGQYRKDLKRLSKQGKDLNKLTTVLDTLLKGEKLAEKYRDHPLIANHKGERECHIEGNWLLDYKIEENTLTLIALRTGTHKEVLNKESFEYEYSNECSEEYQRGYIDGYNSVKKQKRIKTK